MSSRARTASTGGVEWPLVLHSGSGRARVRPWWRDPTVAQLTFTDHGNVPPSTALRVWLSELRARGFSSVRSGAVTAAGADTLQQLGFEVVQNLHLLDLSLVGWRAPGGITTRSSRLRVRDRDAAAGVDRAAFGDTWAIDSVGIAETCAATPAHRARAVESNQFDPVELGPAQLDPAQVDPARSSSGGPIAYAITGRADHTGYLQRLAVHPAYQGRGAGRCLTRDSLVWMQRRRLTRAMVNTHTDNVVALQLYQDLGFRVLPQGLVVLRRDLDNS